MTTVFHRYNLRSKSVLRTQPDDKKPRSSNQLCICGSICDVVDVVENKSKKTTQKQTQTTQTQTTQTQTTQTHDKNLLLIFDVETTGLLKRDYMTKQIPEPDKCPFITQLSYIIYDISQKKKIEIFNSYIKLDSSIKIPQIVTDLTGITQEICQEQGHSITDVLVAFYEAYRRCGTIVSHNMVFDSDMILTELQRNHNSMVIQGCDYPSCLFNKYYNVAHNIELFCTMISSTNICNIIVESNNRGRLMNNEWIVMENVNGFMVKKRMHKKWPKLSELHFHLFGTIPEGLHDSAIDTEACLRCYLKMI